MKIYGKLMRIGMELKMSLMALFFTAFGLSMDAFAVSVTNGMCMRQFKVGNAFKVGLYFGFFQAFMPILGWIAGISFSTYIKNVDHWIAFVLLSFIGMKMLLEGLKSKAEGCHADNDNRNDNKSLFILAIATSIDALAVGVSFAFLKISIISSALLIGFVTFIISVAGVFLGKRFGKLLGKRAEILGGVILIIIGTKILIEHYM